MILPNLHRKLYFHLKSRLIIDYLPNSYVHNKILVSSAIAPLYCLKYPFVVYKSDQKTFFVIFIHFIPDCGFSWTNRSNLNILSEFLGSDSLMNCFFNRKNQYWISILVASRSVYYRLNSLHIFFSLFTYINTNVSVSQKGTRKILLDLFESAIIFRTITKPILQSPQIGVAHTFKNNIILFRQTN